MDDCVFKINEKYKEHVKKIATETRIIGNFALRERTKEVFAEVNKELLVFCLLKNRVTYATKGDVKFSFDLEGKTQKTLGGYSVFLFLLLPENYKKEFLNIYSVYKKNNRWIII